MIPAASDKLGLAAALTSLSAQPGTLLVAWLGQAGFVFKTSVGRLIVVDPYLSSDAERSHGLIRLAPAPLDAEDITPDVLLVTHSHADHLDPPTIRAYGARAATTLVGPAAVCAAARDHHGWRGPLVPLAVGEVRTVDEVAIEATWTRHGGLGATEAIGFLLRVDGLTVWHLGDTEYDARLHQGRARDIDVAFLPINGSGGNMNAFEAALLGWHLNAGALVPMHYGMWSDEGYTYGGSEPWATPDPEQFTRTLEALAPNAASHVPTLGTPIRISRSNQAGEQPILVSPARNG